jgi:hypothetical protein
MGVSNQNLRGDAFRSPDNSLNIEIWLVEVRDGRSIWFYRVDIQAHPSTITTDGLALTGDEELDALVAIDDLMIRSGGVPGPIARCTCRHCTSAVTWMGGEPTLCEQCEGGCPRCHRCQFHECGCPIGGYRSGRRQYNFRPLPDRPYRDVHHNL